MSRPGGILGDASRRGLLALAVLAPWACVPPPSEPATPAGGDPLEAAVQALERDEFVAASRALGRRIASCDESDPEVRGRATLLLAAAELDVANRDGSADRAALLASWLIRDPDASPERVALARSVYRLAVDRGAQAPEEDAEGPPCVAPGRLAAAHEEASNAHHGSVRGLPAIPSPTTEERLAELRDRLSATADSLRVARDGARRSAARVAELEAELERIRTLLKGRPPPS